MVFGKEWIFLILMTKKECYLYTNSFHSHHWRNFKCWLSSEYGSERTFSYTVFFLSSEKSEVFWSLWLIRSATSIQTVFTVIIGKIFSADFHLNTEVRGLFLTLFLVFWKERIFLIPMTYKDCYLYTNSFHGHQWKKL